MINKITAEKSSTWDRIRDFEQGYIGLELIGYEVVETEKEETPVSWNGSEVGYYTFNVTSVSFMVTGVKIVSHGIHIYSMFKEPIALFEETLDDSGERIGDFSWNDGQLESAIVSRLGNIKWVRENI